MKIQNHHVKCNLEHDRSKKDFWGTLEKTIQISKDVFQNIRKKKTVKMPNRKWDTMAVVRGQMTLGRFLCQNPLLQDANLWNHGQTEAAAKQPLKQIY